MLFEIAEPALSSAEGVTSFPRNDTPSNVFASVIQPLSFNRPDCEAGDEPIDEEVIQDSRGDADDKACGHQ